MTLLEGHKVQIEEQADDVISFLLNLENHSQLMPSKVSDWNATSDQVSLKIQGLGTLNLKKDSSKANILRIYPEGKVPFPIEIFWKWEKIGNDIIVFPYIEAEMNMMIKMMASTPLKEFLEYQSNKLKSIFTSK